MAAAASLSSTQFKASLEEAIDRSFGDYARTGSCTCVKRIAGDIMADYGRQLTDVEQRDILAELRTRIDRMPEDQRAGVFLRREAKASAYQAIDAMQGKAPLDAARNAQEWQTCLRTWDEGGRKRAERMNREVFESTCDDVRSYRRIDPSKHVRMLDETYYVSDTRFVDPRAARGKTDYVFLNLSTFDAVDWMLREDRDANPLVLDMANKTDVGGAPDRASAQEETLCRCSDLYFGLSKFSHDGRKYAKPKFPGGIYVPYVQVFREGPEKGYAYRERPFTCAVFASAAYNCNLQHRGGYDRPADETVYRNGMKHQMRVMFRTAHIENHDSLVLGAFGCGAFKNDPAVVSQLYREVLAEPEFDGIFRKVVFAIIDMGGTNNFRIFQRTFRDAEPAAPLPPPAAARAEAAADDLPPPYEDLPPPPYDDASRPKSCMQKVTDRCTIS